MNYKKEYKKYLASSILDTANNKIASNSFITAFAVYLGLSNFAIGIYAVLDTITNIVQIFAAPLFSRIGQSKYVVLTNYTIYRLSSICFAFIPFITENIELRTILFFVFASIYAITGELGYITFVNWIMTLENGYYTKLSANGKNLSDGEKQILCYVRTIINNPKILIFDEATSKVDVKTEKMLQNLTTEMIKNKTLITIAHRLSTIKDSDKILFVKDKKIAESGTHKELMQLQGNYYDLYSSQSKATFINYI